MQRASFNDDWEYRPKENPFLEMLGDAAPWTPVRLPHDAMIATRRDPSEAWGTGYFPGGVWEYRKTFHVPEEHADKRVLLEFEGVYRSAVLYVNESFAAHRPYGYSDFTVRADELLRFGADNVVRVVATAHDDARWYSGAGIYRNVRLVVAGLVHVALDGVTVTTPDVDDARAVVEVATTIENDTARPAATTVTTEITGPDGALVARDASPATAWPGRPQTVRQRVVVTDPMRWSIDTPSLYTCTTVLTADGTEIDRSVTTFGVRTLQLDAEQGLRINGEVVDLRGACVHHDNGVIGAATIERADERRVEILKAAGFNALRSAHNPMSRAMLDACDRLGMLVMDESFDVWTEPKTDDDYSRAFPDWWEADVTAMVTKDVNHPSVVMYSIGNEIQEVGRADGAARGRAMAETIRRLDPTRYVTNSINPLLAVGGELFASFDAPPAGVDESSGVNTLMTMMREYLPIILQNEIVGERTAESYAAVDVAGYNYVHSRYELDHDRFPNRVIVGSETSPADIPGNWALVRRLPHVIGDFTWTGWDYLGEAGIGRVEYGETAPTSMLGALMGAYPWLTARTGDVDITGFRRPVSYLREIVFGLRTDPYVVVGYPQHHGESPSYESTWSYVEGASSWSWRGFEGKPVRVEVLADADEVELLVNDVPVGREAVGATAPYRASFDTVFEPGSLVAIAYRGGAEVGRTGLRSAGSEVRLDARVDRAEIRADDTDLAYLDIALVDDEGIVHVGADRAVTVAVDGPAVLQGLGSANPRTEETFGAATHDTFEGRALAVLRPTGPGDVAVTVSADGCDPVTVDVRAR